MREKFYDYKDAHPQPLTENDYIAIILSAMKEVLNPSEKKYRKAWFMVKTGFCLFI